MRSRLCTLFPFCFLFFGWWNDPMKRYGLQQLNACGPGLNNWKSHQFCDWLYGAWQSIQVYRLYLLCYMLWLQCSIAKIKAEGLSTLSESSLHERSRVFVYEFRPRSNTRAKRTAVKKQQADPQEERGVVLSWQFTPTKQQRCNKEECRLNCSPSKTARTNWILYTPARDMVLIHVASCAWSFLQVCQWENAWSIIQNSASIGSWERESRSFSTLVATSVAFKSKVAIFLRV